jgi:hypothetical protein
MADPPGYPDTGDDTGVGPDRGSSPGTPRWVKVSAAIVLVLVLVFVVLKVTGLGGEHGPGRHTGGGETPPASVREADGAGGDTSPAGVREADGAGGHTPPAAGHTP